MKQVIYSSATRSDPEARYVSVCHPDRMPICKGRNESKDLVVISHAGRDLGSRDPSATLRSAPNDTRVHAHEPTGFCLWFPRDDRFTAFSRAASQARRAAVLTFTTCICLLLGLTGCGPSGDKPDEGAGVDKNAPKVEDFSWGPIEFKLTATPPRVHLDRDTVLTLTMTTPSEVDVDFPAMVDRLIGFTIGGTIDRDPVTTNGKTRRVRRIRLTPVVAEEYRIGPMAVEYTDRSASPQRQSWYATRPVVFECTAVVEGGVDSEISDDLKARWIYPPFRTIATWVILLLLLIALTVAMWKLWPRLKRAHKLRRMSPKERALFELDELLSKHLIEQNRPKDFYIELTMIVRRYVERVHAIHAPEQTTEEFLGAVSQDERFSPEVVARLKAFLEAADLVKFAAQDPTPEAVDTSVQTARDYVISDSRRSEEAPQG